MDSDTDTSLEDAMSNSSVSTETDVPAIISKTADNDKEMFDNQDENISAKICSTSCNETEVSDICNITCIEKEMIDNMKAENVSGNVCKTSDIDKSTDKDDSVIEKKKLKIKKTPRGKKTTISVDAKSSPKMFSELMGAPESMDVSANDVTLKKMSEIDVPSKDVPAVDVTPKNMPAIDVTAKTSPAIDVTPKNMPAIDVTAKTSPAIDVTPKNMSSIDVTPENVSVVTIPDTSADTPPLEKSTKRKLDESSKDETPSKKSRPSCMVIYDSTPQRKESSIPLFDLTKETSLTEEVIIDDNDEEENDFSLRLDSQNGSIEHDEPSQNEEKDVVSQDLSNTWKSHKKSSEKGNVSERNSSWSSQVDKENDLSWHSHKEYNTKEDYAALKMKYDELEKKYQAKVDKSSGTDGQTLQPSGNSPDTNASKESLHSFLEKCFMCGNILFTVNEATNQIISAEVKQLSLLGNSAIEKTQKTSLSSGYLADKSFSSGTSGDSRVSMPGPFNLPMNRCSLLSTVSSSSSATSVLSSANAYPRVTGIRNWDGPFLVPSVPALKNLKDHISHPLSGFGHFFPAVDNLEEFLYGSSFINGSPEHYKGSAKHKVSMFESLDKLKKTTKDIKTNQIKETVIEENEEKEETDEKDDKADIETVVDVPQKKGRGRGKRNKSVTPAKWKVSIPAKAMKAPIIAIEKEEQVKPEGKAVFAKWSDSQYYPGWVSEDMNSSRVKVHFCDGNVNVLSSVKVIPADWLKAGTMALTQQRDKNEYSPCLVMDVELGGSNGPDFIVDDNLTSNKVNFSQIALTETQVIEIKEEAIATGRMSSLHLVSLDNVLSHPRTRTPSRSTTTSTRTPRGTTTSSRKKTIAKEPEPSTSNGLTSALTTIPDIAGDTDGSVSSTAGESIRGNEEILLDPECSPQEFPLDSKRKTSEQKQVKSTTKKSKKVLEDDFTMEQNYGPYPEEGSSIFAGCNFLLTYTAQKKVYNAKQESSSSYDDGKQSTGDEEFEAKSFNKQRLRTQIKKGGGTLYRTLTQIPTNEYSHTYLITDAPSCTPLYLQCLVHGITICNHKRIIDCCKQNRSFKEMINKTYLLPAGWSLERSNFKNQQKNVQPFKKLKEGILLALNQNKASVQFWKKLLQAAGAKVYVYTDRGVTNLDRISVIVADFDCNGDLIDEANISNVPVVSLIWVEQCIIDGVLRPFQGHPDYKYNHIIEPQSPEY